MINGHFRPGTDDCAMWSDVFVRDEYGVAGAVDGMSVLDVGGGIGSFAAKCLSEGAKMVASVEANHETCDVYRKAMSGALGTGKAVLIEAAAWSKSGNGTLRLYAGGVRSGDTLVFSPAGEDVGVKLLAFSALLDVFEPDAVKVDAEGSEYELFKPPVSLPPSVKLAWVEFHETLKQPWKSKMEEVLESFDACGWGRKCIKEIHDTKLYVLRR